MGIRLGIDVACRAPHQVSCADETGEFVFTGRRFKTTVDDLQRLWASLPDTDDVLVVMEPTRNAWIPLASWFRGQGATVILVPPEQSADLRDYYNKHTKTDKLDSRVLELLSNPVDRRVTRLVDRLLIRRFARRRVRPGPRS